MTTLKKTTQLFIALTVMLIAACSSGEQNEGNNSSKELTHQELVEKIEANQKDLSSIDDLNKIMTIANQQMELCAEFAVRFPNDTAAANYLYWGGNAARMTQSFQAAINMYNQFIQAYPSHKKRPEVMFVKGFVLAEELNEKDKAKKAFEQILIKYPTHSLAEDAKAMITQLYMNDDELLEFLKGKAATQGQEI